MKRFRCLIWLLACAAIAFGQLCPLVSRFDNYQASIEGGSEIIAYGCGFATGAFSLDASDETIGNHVYIKSSRSVLKCVLVEQGENMIKFTVPRTGYRGWHSILFRVNGTLLPRGRMRCSRSGCNVNLQKRAFTTDIYPRYSLPNATVTVTGKIITSRFGGNLDAFVVGPPQSIRRIYNGGYDCDPRKPNSNVYYGLTADETTGMGYFSCRLGGSYIGNENITFILDPPFGRGSKEIYYDSKGNAFMHQSFAVPKSIKETEDLIVRIEGDYLDVSPGTPIDVELDGNKKCMVVKNMKEYVLCKLMIDKAKTSWKAEDFVDGRGCLRYFIPYNTAIGPSHLRTIDLEKLPDDSVTVVGAELIYDTRRENDLTGDPVAPKPNMVLAMVATFIPTYSGPQQFEVMGITYRIIIVYDQAGTKIADSNGWTPVLDMKAGEKYKIVIMSYVLNNKGVLFMRQRDFTSSVSAEQTSRHTLTTIQRITTSFDPVDEKQQLNFADLAGNTASGKQDKQEIRFGSTADRLLLCLYNSCTQSYTGEEWKAEALQAWLIEALGTGQAVVDKSTDAKQKVFEVTFSEDLGEVPLFTGRAGDLAIADEKLLTVKKLAAGVLGATSNIRLAYKGIPTSQTIPQKPTLDQVKAIVPATFKNWCPKNFMSKPDGAEYFEDNEAEGSTEAAFCGGRSRLYRSYTEQKSDPQVYKYWCYALHKNCNGSFKLKYKGIMRDGSAKDLEYVLTDKPKTAPGLDWSYYCHDVLELLGKANPSAGFIKYEILGYWQSQTGSDSCLIDNLLITSNLPTPTPSDAASFPRNVGLFLSATEVAAASRADVYDVTLKLDICTAHFDLITIAGVPEKTGSSAYPSKMLEQHFESWTAGKKFATKSLAQKSNFLTGTFTLKALGKETLPIQVYNEVDLRYKLGDVVQTVHTDSKHASCVAHEINVYFHSHGGVRMLASVGDTSKLVGVNPKVTLSVQRRGYLNNDQIAADFLYRPSKVRNVAVTVNGISTMCMDQKACNVDFHTDGTAPKLTGGAFSLEGTEKIPTLKLTGTELLSTKEDAYTFEVYQTNADGKGVAVAYAVAKANTATSIMSTDFDVAKLPAGSMKVKLHIGRKGTSNAIDVDFGTTSAVISSVVPATGSEEGGLIVTLKGSRFNYFGTPDVRVGDKACNVVKVEVDRIECLLPQKGSESSAEIKVNQLGSTIAGASPIKFTYESTTAKLTSVDGRKPTGTADASKPNVIATGTGFEKTDVFHIVELGKSFQTVFESTDKLSGPVPQVSEGKLYTLRIFRPGYGLLPGSAQLDYRFTVTSVSSAYGSQFGGKRLTIKGTGFGPATAVYLQVIPEGLGFVRTTEIFGDRRVKCQTEVKSESEIQVITSPFSRTHDVMINGSNADGNGIGSDFPTRSIKIYRGDKVRWIWTAQPSGFTLGYKIEQISGFGQGLVEKGFAMNEVLKYGSYTVEFRETGIFYVRNGALHYVQMAIEVLEMPPAIVQIVVEQNGAEATYSGLPSSNPPQPPDNLQCIDMRCEVLTLVGTPKKARFIFGMQGCTSPKVKGLSKTQAHMDDVIALETIGLAKCEAKVKPAFTVAGTALNFSLGADAVKLFYAEPNYWSLTHSDFGDAIITEWPGEGPKVLFVLPSIVKIASGATGGRFGRSKFVITVAGLDKTKPEDNVVKIDGKVCRYEKIEPPNLTCRTPVPTSVSATEKTKEVPFTLAVKGTEAKCMIDTGCKFTYDISQASMVNSVTPSTLTSCSNLTLSGQFKVPSELKEAHVYFNNAEYCKVTKVNTTTVECSMTKCVDRTTYIINYIDDEYGAAAFTVSPSLSVKLAVTKVEPLTGSTEGGTIVSFTGFALNTPIEVYFGSKKAELIQAYETAASTLSAIVPAGSGAVPITLKEGSELLYTHTAKFTYADNMTPKIGTPSFQKKTMDGAAMTEITIPYTTSLKEETLSFYVLLGETEAKATSYDTTKCIGVVESLPAGKYPIKMLVFNEGLAKAANPLEIPLNANSVVAKSIGSYGKVQVSLKGTGFAGKDTDIKVCDEKASILSGDNFDLTMLLPKSKTPATDIDCSIVLKVGESTFTMPEKVTYKPSLTPKVTSITPSRGGTGGGTKVTIIGEQFGTSKDIQVTLGESKCKIEEITDTTIKCETSSAKTTEFASVSVINPEKGESAPGDVKFHYIDRWSSVFTWGGKTLPTDGDLVSIPKGKTVMLDTDTAKLTILIIDGGTLYFDPDSDASIHAKYILILKGGVLQIGTEKEPYLKKGSINLYGNVHLKELPIYGAKVLALRDGTVDIHGKPIKKTWVKLAHSAASGTDTVTVKDAVEDWNVGDQIVLSSTGRNGTFENEVHQIKGLDAAKTTITLSRPLKYTKHAEVIQYDDAVGKFTFAGEVGLLTRNVVIRGVMGLSAEDTERCPNEVELDTFNTQSCSMGKPEEQSGVSEYGGQIFINPPTPKDQVVTFRISGAELTNMGQAFRLGRYPIHFHLVGHLPSGYVRKCSIHHVFNRAINIHNTHQINVADNVVFDVKGGALFLEDSVETSNVIERNLFIYVKASNSLLNDDVTPASYWITNPNNTIRYNVAAGGSHFGYWYRMLQHPTGPSFDKSICPKNIQLGSFEHNEVHSQGGFGLWIHEDYFPKKSSGCGGGEYQLAEFKSFTTWNNGKGAECVNCGAVTFKNMVSANNREAQLEWHLTYNNVPYSLSLGASFQDNVVIGFEPRLSPADAKCTSTGLVLPWYIGFSMKNIKFVNFNGKGCSAMHGTIITCICSSLCGGYIIKASELAYYNSDSRGDFRWTMDYALLDTDGSATRGLIGVEAKPNHYIIGKGAHYPRADCPESIPGWSSGGVPAVRCSPKATPIRFTYKVKTPSSMTSAESFISLDKGGTQSVAWRIEGITYNRAYAMFLIQGHRYTMGWKKFDELTLFSYEGLIENFYTNDYVIIRHENVTAKPDRYKIFPNDEMKKFVEVPIDPLMNAHGDTYYSSEGQYVEYLMKPPKADGTTSVKLDFVTIKCEYKDCIKPVETETPSTTRPVVSGVLTRPSDALYWSKDVTWAKDGKLGEKPKDGSNFTIPKGTWLVVDQSLDLKFTILKIEGTLEIADGTEKEPLTVSIEARHVLIKGGRFIAGINEKTPLVYTKLTMKLYPDKDGEVDYLSDFEGSILGPMSFAVFGDLILHGKPVSVAWTQISEVAKLGATSIKVKDAVDWMVGDEFVIAGTDFSHKQNEVRKITKVVQNEDKTTTLSFADALKFSHIVYDKKYGTFDVKLGAEVGLLDRSIVITGPEDALETKKSGRILVSSLTSGTIAVGRAIVKDVAFKKLGRTGFIGSRDPRFALAFVNAGNLNENVQYESYVKSCVFRDSVNTAVGVLQSSNLRLYDNVMYNTISVVVRLLGTGHEMSKNLLVEQMSDTTILEAKLPSFSGMLDIGDTEESATLTGNVFAGGEHIGISSAGHPCGVANKWKDNIVHSTNIGFNTLNMAIGDCIQVTGLTIYSCYRYSIYLQTTASVNVQNVKLLDNHGPLYTYIYFPDGRSHAKSNKYYRVQNSLIAGTTGVQSCKRVTDVASLNKGGLFGGPGSPYGGMLGMTFGLFPSRPNAAFKMGYPAWFADMALGGKTIIRDVTVARFGEFCSGAGDVFIRTDGAHEDYIHETFLKGITKIEVNDENRVFIDRPSAKTMTSSACGTMVCDAKRKILVTDSDGGLLGSPGTIIPEAEFGWGKDYGIGNNRLPEKMVTKVDGTKKDIDQEWPLKGIVRSDSCKLDAKVQGYVCSSTVAYYDMFLESLDSDSLSRRLGPIAFATQGLTQNFVDLINGPSDHYICSGYVCNLRASLFPAIVRDRTNFLAYFTASMPQNLRLQIPNADGRFKIRVAIPYESTYRLDVYADGLYIMPTNGRYNDKRQLILDAPQKPDTFYPEIEKNSVGSNYYSDADKLLYVIVEGQKVIDIKINRQVKISFGIPNMTENDFFKGDVVGKIAKFLGIPSEKIRIVNTVSEGTGTATRAKRETSSLKINLEIVEPPVTKIETEVEVKVPKTDTVVPDADPNNPEQKTTTTTTTPAPTKPTEPVAEKDTISKAFSKIVDGLQTGELAAQVGVKMENVELITPPPLPSDPNYEKFLKSDTANVAVKIDQIKSVKFTTYGELKARIPVLFKAEMLNDAQQHAKIVGSIQEPWSIKYKMIDGPANAKIYHKDPIIFDNDKDAYATGYVFFSMPGMYKIEGNVLLSDGKTSSFKYDITLAVAAGPALKLKASLADTEQSGIKAGQKSIIKVQLNDEDAMATEQSLSALPVAYSIAASVCSGTEGNFNPTTAVLSAKAISITFELTGIKTAGSVKLCFTPTTKDAADPNKDGLSGYDLTKLEYPVMVYFEQVVYMRVNQLTASIKDKHKEFTGALVKYMESMTKETRFEVKEISGTNIEITVTMYANPQAKLDDAYKALTDSLTSKTLKVNFEGTDHVITDLQKDPFKKLKMFYVKFDESYSTVSSSMDEFKGEFVKQMDAKYPDTKFTVNEVYEGSIILSVTLTADDTTKLEKTFDDMTAKATSKGLSITYKAKSMAVTQVTTTKPAAAQKTKMFYVKFDESYSTVSSSMDEFKGEFVKQMDAKYPDTKFTVNEVYEGSIILSVTLTAVDNTKLEKTFDDMTAKATSKGLSITYKAKSMAVTQVTTTKPSTVTKSRSIYITFKNEFSLVAASISQFKADIKKQMEQKYPGVTTTVLDVYEGSINVDLKLESSSSETLASTINDINSKITAGAFMIDHVGGSFKGSAVSETKPTVYKKKMVYVTIDEAFSIVSSSIDLFMQQFSTQLSRRYSDSMVKAVSVFEGSINVQCYVLATTEEKVDKTVAQLKEEVAKKLVYVTFGEQKLMLLLVSDIKPDIKQIASDKFDMKFDADFESVKDDLSGFLRMVEQNLELEYPGADFSELTARKGSIIVEGAIKAPSEESLKMVTTEMIQDSKNGDLQLAYKGQVLKVAEMKVERSQSEYNKIPLIVGLTVGIVLFVILIIVIIAVIWLLVYKRQNASSNQSLYYVSKGNYKPSDRTSRNPYVYDNEHAPASDSHS